MMDLALLNAEIANGMYRNPIEAIAKEFRYDPFPDEVRAVIIARHGHVGDCYRGRRLKRWCTSRQIAIIRGAFNSITRNDCTLRLATEEGNAPKAELRRG